jgi:hypothetical protein
MVRHRASRLRQPTVADRADAQADQVDGLAVAHAEFAKEASTHRS